MYYVGQRVCHAGVIAVITSIETNRELGVRYYRIRVNGDSNEITVRSREINSIHYND